MRGVRPFIFGHLGDGNLHYNLARPNDAPLDWSMHDGKTVAETVLQSVAEHGGSISAEHDIGQLKRDAFLRYKPPFELQLMRQLKDLFDPLNILNPGKLLKIPHSRDRTPALRRRLPTGNLARAGAMIVYGLDWLSPCPFRGRRSSR
jgi:hypothetical protein